MLGFFAAGPIACMMGNGLMNWGVMGSPYPSFGPRTLHQIGVLWIEGKMQEGKREGNER